MREENLLLMTVKYIKIQGEKILMKDKKINIISPAVAIIVAILDLAVLGYGIFAAVKLVEQFSSLSIIFAVIEVFALVIAVLVSKEVLSNGVISEMMKRNLPELMTTT